MVGDGWGWCENVEGGGRGCRDYGAWERNGSEISKSSDPDVLSADDLFRNRGGR
jgi:hypothetical protein